jgi:Arm DNA-binding domain
MARRRTDGKPSRPTHKERLTDFLIRKMNGEATRYTVWDTQLPGLALAVNPTGKKVFKCVYSKGGQPRWYTIGNAAAIDLKSARDIATKVLVSVAAGSDPHAERMAEKGEGTFGELATAYVERYSKKKRKSWKQSDSLIRKHLIPVWGILRASAITRSDVRAAMAKIESESVAN